jgi:hypothetical protein
MKRENLYLVSAALLASTSLSTTAATAGTVGIYNPGYQNTLSATTPVRVSAQVFASTPSATQQIGATGALAYRFASTLNGGNVFSGTIGVTGAQFLTSAVVNQAGIRAFAGTVVAGGVVTLALANAGSISCAGLVATTTSLIINNCSNAMSLDSQSSFSGFVISTVAFDNATGLATAGGSISIAGTINLGVSAGTGAVFDTTAAQAIITSANSVTTTVTAATGVAQINVSASPAFSRLVGGGSTVTVATVTITTTGTLAADLTTPITVANAVGATNFIRLTSAILSDDAVSKVQIAGVGSTTPTQFGSGAVTFTIAAASTAAFSTFAIEVNFNGTAAIDVAAAGTVDVSYVTAGAQSQTANSAVPASGSGAAAGLTRSGLSININGIQPGIAQGLTYQSFLRIVNSSATAGAATVVLRNNDTGVVLGTYTSPSIPGSGSVQVSAGNLESGAGITPSASVLYQATISGAFNGYVQHVVFNANSGAFSDLSAAPRTN